MSETILMGMKTCLQVENGLSMLDRYNSAGGETFTVADSVYIVQNRCRWVSRAQEIGM